MPSSGHQIQKWNEDFFLPKKKLLLLIIESGTFSLEKKEKQTQRFSGVTSFVQLLHQY